MSVVKRLFGSRKFLILLLDTAVSLTVLIGGWFAAPEAIEMIAAVVAIIQPVFVMIIFAIAKEDAAAYEAGVHPNS